MLFTRWNPKHLFSVTTSCSTAIIVLILFIFPTSLTALEPDEILVVYNSRHIDSINLAFEYKEKRGIPEQNMFNIVSSSFYRISRETYDTAIKEPIEEYLEEQHLKDKILCILLMYRVPLIIDDRDKDKRIKKIEQELSDLKNRLIQLREDTKIQEANAKIKQLEKELTKTQKERRDASVDSELCLLFQKYPLNMWRSNPYFIGRKKTLPHFDNSFQMYMVARLDAPHPSIVSRVIRETIEAEQTGLFGNAYIDTRGYNKPNATSAYEAMDNLLLQTGDLLEKKGINTIVEKTSSLFGKDACPNTAIYWGWYALSDFRDSFTFVPGAIAVHIASIECHALHSSDKYWCPNLLKKGASVTIGPVNEPYLNAFPNPVIFMSVLFEGFSLAEAYFASQPLLSWQMVLVGDPLYRPYKNGIPLSPPKQSDNDSSSTTKEKDTDPESSWKAISY